MSKPVLVLVCAAAIAAVAGRTWAEELPDGYGVFAPSKSTFRTTIGVPNTNAEHPRFVNPGDDVDEYVFQGYPAMSLTVVVKPVAHKGDVPLVPLIQFVRPGGTLASEEEGFVFAKKSGSYQANMTLDTPGWWQVRVRGANIALPATPPTVPLPVYSAGDYSVQITYKLPASQQTLPVVTKSFSRKGTIDTNSDTDDFAFEGYPGQTLSASAVASSGSALKPGIALFDPTLTRVGLDDPAFGLDKITKFVLDKQGTWRVRVSGRDPTSPPDPLHNRNTMGPYTVSVSLSKPPQTPSLVPDVNNQYKFVVPATGGAKIGYTFSFTTAKGAEAPEFNGLFDPTGRVIPGSPAKASVPSYQIPAPLRIGNYTLAFDAPATLPSKTKFSLKMTPPKGGKGRSATLAAEEPVIVINGIYPTTGAGGTPLSVSTAGKLVDPNDQDASKIALFIDHVACDSVTVTGSTSLTVHGIVPFGLDLGKHSVVVQSTTGQVAVALDAFEVIAPPVVTSIDPAVGSISGGYPLTITGSGFSKLSDAQITINGFNNIIGVNINRATMTDTSITFIAPPYGAAGAATFGVIDANNNVHAELPILIDGHYSFEYISSPAINRVVPNLISVLGGTQIVVTGANFNPTDKVYLENAKGSVPANQLLTNTYTAGVNGGLPTHRFIAPVRPKGVYLVYVTDQFNQPQPFRTRTLTYFQFSNLADQTQNIFPSGSDSWDGVTTAVADFDKDGADDLFISRVGGATAAQSSETRVLKNQNDGTGRFVDVTDTVMPPASSADDWRADRIWVTDVDPPAATQVSYPDIVMVTNDSSVLSQNRSHVRILVNEAMNGQSATERVFRDRTSVLFAPVRISNPLYTGNGGVADYWRGLDMWVGDVDGASGPPEILITSKYVKQELDVSCSPYCSSPFSGGYTYGFYWGGSAEFQWDKSKNGGLGQYKFNRNFFPRRAGLRVPVGMNIPICNASYGQPCVGKFTPFIGKRIAVGSIDVQALNPQQASLPDIAVLSDEVVTKNNATISSLQVALNQTGTVDGITSQITDVTAELTALGGDLSGDTVEICQPGFPSPNAYGVIALTKATASPGGSSVMRMIQFKPPTVTTKIAEFQEVTTGMLPTVTLNDRWQASKILFRDVDGDGDQDMVLICNPQPGGTSGTAPAFRILLNDIVNGQTGVFREDLRQLVLNLVTGTEHLEGDTMCTGDANRDGFLDFFITRKGTSAASPQTRIILTDAKN